MSYKTLNEQHLLPSLLDRIAGDDSIINLSGDQSFKQFEESLRHDIQDLLNTSLPFLSWPDGWKELEFSLVNFGLPDFTANSVTSNQKHELLRQYLEHCLTNFESRFKSVNVYLEEVPNVYTRTIYFRIEATVYLESTHQTFLFDTLLNLSTGKFHVKGNAHG